MKAFQCKICAAPLGYTDGLRLVVPIQFIDPLGFPRLNLMEISSSPAVLTCSCGETRKWYRQNPEYRVVSNEVIVSLPLA